MLQMKLNRDSLVNIIKPFVPHSRQINAIIFCDPLERCGVASDSNYSSV